ncbi:MAG: hypothetical protein M1833_006003 [Piccolia ochrophora]|nr:MAG: hypothetical protein M1833_006003 [Piccolia ochrophora]
MASLIAIAYFNCVELWIQIFITLKGLKGLYFWSLAIGTVGVFVHVTGDVLRFFVPETHFALYDTFILSGWWGMIIGQSLVLYSRLYLVVKSQKLLLAVRIMIGTGFAAFLIPTTVMLYLANSPMSNEWVPKWGIIERVQLCGFMVQEMAMSVIYIFATRTTLKNSALIRAKKVLRFLIITNVLIISLDCVVIGMEFSNWYAIQATLKPCVYSIKFKLEFAFLNQLLYIARHSVADVKDPKSGYGSRAGKDATNDTIALWPLGNIDNSDGGRLNIGMRRLSGSAVNNPTPLPSAPATKTSQSDSDATKVDIPAALADPSARIDFQNEVDFVAPSATMEASIAGRKGPPPRTAQPKPPHRRDRNSRSGSTPDKALPSTPSPSQRAPPPALSGRARRQANDDAEIELTQNPYTRMIEERTTERMRMDSADRVTPETMQRLEHDTHDPEAGRSRSRPSIPVERRRSVEDFGGRDDGLWRAEVGLHEYVTGDVETPE